MKCASNNVTIKHNQKRKKNEKRKTKEDKLLMNLNRIWKQCTMSVCVWVCTFRFQEHPHNNTHILNTYLNFMYPFLFSCTKTECSSIRSLSRGTHNWKCTRYYSKFFLYLFLVYFNALYHSVKYAHRHIIENLLTSIRMKNLLEIYALYVLSRWQSLLWFIFAPCAICSFIFVLDRKSNRKIIFLYFCCGDRISAFTIAQQSEMNLNLFSLAD